MSGTKFTPGPWKIGGEWPQIVAVYDSRCVYIAHANTGVGAEWVSENRLGRDVAQANAHLIAAAPELYGALADMLRAFGNEAEEAVAHRKAEAALRKARGETV